MRRWRRRVAVAASLALAVLIVRTVRSLSPPSLPVPLEWNALIGVTVINPGRDRRDDQTVTLRGGRIESIRDREPNPQLLPRERVFEHRYVLPGLIDMDVRRVPSIGHLQRLFGVFFLAAGVTTVRDVGTFDGSIPELQHRIAAGEFPWPRLVACGRGVEGEPPLCPPSRIVREPGDALAAVELLSAAPATPPARALADWIRGWQALDRGGLDALVASAAPGSTITPTLWRWTQLARAGDPALQQTPFAEFLPRVYRAVIWPREIAASMSTGLEPAAVAAAVATMQQAVRQLHAAGVRVNVGSGTPSPWVVPGLSVWLEMQSLRAAGLTLEDAWVAATRAAGESLGIPQLGTLEAGAPADLLIFRKDPTQDSDAFMSLEAVVSQGRLYPERRLNGDVLEYARYVQGTVYDWLSMTLARLMTWWNSPPC